jgi:hypothetical protein
LFCQLVFLTLVENCGATVLMQIIEQVCAQELFYGVMNGEDIGVVKGYSLI